MDELLLRSLLKLITKGLRHELLEDFKKVDERNTLVKIKLGNIKRTFGLNFWLNSSMNIVQWRYRLSKFRLQIPEFYVYKFTE